jgi:serine/threonine protein kinase
MAADAVGGTDNGARPDPVRLGPYRLVQRLGEGGMGVVHLALDAHGRAVALKVLRPHIAHDPQARTRLAREVETLARVSSPRVAPVIDADVDGERPYIVTRYVPGPPLDEVVGAEGPMDAEPLHRLGAGLAEALRVIHGAGVIHRDLKPGNVLLVDGDPVLIDFGIAHAVDDVRLTMTGLVMGTPGYLAPEVVEGEEVSQATDWWGWAATLAFAASGAPPFGRGPMEAVLARVTRGEPDLSTVDPRIAPLLYAALSPRPAERPHHDEVVAALSRFAQGGPVTDAVELRRVVNPTQAFAIPRTSVLSTRAPSGPPHSGPPAGRPVGPPAGPQPGSPPAWASGAPPVPASSGTPPGVLPPPGPHPGAPVLPPGGGPVSGGAIPPSGRPPAPWPGQQPMPPRPPQDLVPQPPAADPRIGRPTRSGTLLALLAVIVAGAAAAPAAAAIAALVWVVVARTADRSVTSIVMRRHERGPRPSDIPVAVLAGPWHFVVGVVAAVFAVLVPLLVGVSGAFAAALVLSANRGAAEPGPPIALAVGGLLAVLMAWWGPGGASLRRGTRSVVRGISPGEVGARIVTALAVVAALLLIAWVASRGGPTWWPRSGPPSIWGSALG